MQVSDDSTAVSDCLEGFRGDFFADGCCFVTSTSDGMFYIQKKNGNIRKELTIYQLNRTKKLLLLTFGPSYIKKP